jgi:hypothetical protein
MSDARMIQVCLTGNTGVTMASVNNLLQSGMVRKVPYLRCSVSVMGYAEIKVIIFVV